MESGVAIGISIAALAVSIISPVFEYFWNKKMNERNLASEYFKELFAPIIYEGLPKAREYIHFSGQEITGVEELEKVLRTIRQKLIYFKKSKPEFYKELLEVIQECENYIITKSGKADSTAFIEFHNNIDEYVEKIYLYINNMYMGKKVKKKRK